MPQPGATSRAGRRNGGAVLRLNRTLCLMCKNSGDMEETQVINTGAQLGTRNWSHGPGWEMHGNKGLVLEELSTNLIELQAPLAEFRRIFPFHFAHPGKQGVFQPTAFPSVPAPSHAQPGRAGLPPHVLQLLPGLLREPRQLCTHLLAIAHLGASRSLGLQRQSQQLLC